MKKNKKVIIAIIAIILIGGISVYLLTNKNVNIFSNEPKVKITKNESSTIEYEDFDNGLVSLKIPKGWKTEVAPTDYIHYTFKVYSPNNPAYMFIFNLKQEGFLKTEKARSTYAKYYPDAVFSKLSPIDPQTTEAFYKVWNSNAKLANEIDFKNEFFPYFNDFNVIENLGNNILGGDIIRATFTDANGKKNQGLFTASVKSIGTYYINTDVWNPFSERVDVSPLNVYNIIIMSTPDEDFNNWQSILDHCLSTIKFSEKFVNGFNNEEQTLVSTIKANQKVYDQISDSIMSSWEARNKSYDIISQKQSDATLGYERVYDTDTNEIYKAQNGFMDNYDGTKYKKITDDMYNLPTAGYIE
ncbi:MAG: hypothetical protein IKG27_00055 [Bacilli bacterium]|nr:hypothetical protein [Bacilli bacterium]